MTRKLEFPTPWRVDDGGWIVAADGKICVTRGGLAQHISLARETALLRRIVAAVNAAEARDE